MKTYLTILLAFFLLMPADTFSQRKSEPLVVTSLSGGTCYRPKGKSKIEIRVGSKLTEKDIIIIESGVTMIAVAPAQKLRYTFKGVYTGMIENYIKQNETSCVKSITAKYVNYLLAQAFHRGKDDSGAKEDNEVTVFRKVGLENDSVTLSLSAVDSLYNTIDSLSAAPVDSI